MEKVGVRYISLERVGALEISLERVGVRYIVRESRNRRDCKRGGGIEKIIRKSKINCWREQD